MPVDYTGTTVLITGASSGLGEEFARRLAARGANLVLVARRIDRLESLASELRISHGREITVIGADLAASGAAKALGHELAGRGIRIDSLINNAGFGTRNLFENEDPERIAEEVRLNVGAVVDLTHEFYPQLLESDRGVLVNVASVGAYQALPMMAVYGATKAFVLSFTEALWFENKGRGLRVLALSPGTTRTEFFDVVGSGGVGAYQTAEQVVAVALRALDRKNPPPSVISGRQNFTNVAASRLITRRALVNIAGSLTARE